MKSLEEMGKYATVVIDPPWPISRIGWAKNEMNGVSVDLHYDTMSIPEITALPINSVLADDALVFIWAVNSFPVEPVQFLTEWGAPYWFKMTWLKNGGIQVPNSPAFNAEWCFVGRKGKPQFQDIKAFSTANYWPRGAHSEKPEGFYDLLRRVTPGPRLDIFGRRRIAGFESWGDEAPEGPPLPSYYQGVFA